MSLAVLTDSTTAMASPSETLSPSAGSSTKTTSPSWSWAKSVMPTVHSSPSWRSHSCDFRYLRLSGSSTINSSLAARLCTRRYCAGLYSVFYPLLSCKRQFHDSCGDRLPADFNVQGRARLFKSLGDPAEGDRPAGEGRDRSGSDGARLFAAFQDAVAVAGNAALPEFEGGEHAVAGRPLQRFTAVVVLVLHDPGHRGAQGVAVRRQFVAEQGKARLEPERVAGSEAARGCPGGGNRFPDGAGGPGRAVHFEAVFSRVAGAGELHRFAGEFRRC